MRVLKKTLFFILILVAALAGIGFLLPRKAHVERAAAIAAPPATVFTLVNGFKNFSKWSPWFALDPGAHTTYDGPDFGVGAKMSWSGDPKTVGSGSQEVIESQPWDRVTCRLTFGGEGEAVAAFVLQPENGGTRVTWSFDADMGMNPISRYFGLTFDRTIGRDYETGLSSLKTLAESLPKADFTALEVELIDTKPVTVAFVAATSGKGDEAIARAIGGAYAQVGRFMKAHHLNQSAPPITINTKWDQSGYQFDAAIPVDRSPGGDIPAASPVQVKQTYGGRALKVVHRGAYRDMPATYDMLIAYAAAHGYEPAGPPWDEYVSDPGKTKEPDLLTNIVMPVR